MTARRPTTSLSRLRSFVDWKRLLVMSPLLLAGAVGIYVLTDRAGPSADTPRALLADTPPGPVEKVGVQRNQLARNFLGTAPDGSVVTLSDLRGTPTIINFWATWCTSCLAELPDFKALQEDLGAENLNIVAVNTGEDSSVAQNFLDHLGADTFHVVMDPTLVVSDAYGVFGMPTTLFLDADGVVRATYVGHLSRDLMDKYVLAAQTATDAGEPPAELRLITTVAREHTLEVAILGEGRVEFRSKSLRCDESYCSSPAVDRFATDAAVTIIERRLTEDPPAIVVSHHSSSTPSALARALAASLESLGDPLYQRPLEIVER